MDIDTWFTAFLLTVLIEGVLFLLVMGWTRRNLAALLVANLATHPLGYWLVVHQGEPFALVEAGIVVVELLVYRLAFRLRWADAAGASALCNGVTIAVSLLL